MFEVGEKHTGESNIPRPAADHFSTSESPMAGELSSGSAVLWLIRWLWDLC